MRERKVRALTERERELFNQVADVETELHMLLHPMPNNELRDKLWKLAKQLCDARCEYRKPE